MSAIFNIVVAPIKGLYNLFNSMISSGNALYPGLATVIVTFFTVFTVYRFILAPIIGGSLSAHFGIGGSDSVRNTPRHSGRSYRISSFDSHYDDYGF